MREMLFVSHANPEDNEFARWITLKLAANGYPVWCDLTRLLGGEVFWDDIEDAIRDRTIKFLYVLSRTSNTKSGPRGELALALATQRSKKLKDFVIPLHIDSLPHLDFNVEVMRVNAISFRPSWATGLAMLLEKLEADNVPKSAGFGPGAVAGWWRKHVSGSEIVRQEPEYLVSNWYPLTSSTLYFHELTRRDTGSLALPEKLPYPGVKHEQYLVSFAPAEDFDGRLGQLSIASTVERSINGDPPDKRPRMWSYKDERAALTNLQRQLWNNFIAERRFASHEFANGAVGVYFKKDEINNDTIWFRNAANKRTWRQVIGVRTQNRADGQQSLRYWHFALEAKPTSHPFFGFTMRSHVLFSDDGVKIWESNERLQRARRSQCKDWWNDKWRDLISATVYWLAQGDLKLPLRAGSNTHVALSSVPLLLESPVSYDEATAIEPEIPFNVDDDDAADDRANAALIPQSNEVGEAERVSVADAEARL